jgi:hypothetical protein
MDSVFVGMTNTEMFSAYLISISSSLGFHDGMNELPKRSILLAPFKIRHFVKLRFFFELQVILKMLCVQFIALYRPLNGTPRLVGVSAIGEATVPRILLNIGKTAFYSFAGAKLLICT